MKITIFAVGSRGDVQPYVALGLGLKKAGHVVSVAAYSFFKEFVESYGLLFYPLSGNPQAHLLRIAHANRNPISFYKQIFSFLSKSFLIDCLKACDNAEAILFSPLGFLADGLRDTSQFPCFPAFYLPLTPTRHFPNYWFPPLSSRFPFRPWYNSLSYQVDEQIMWHYFRQAFNALRKEIPTLFRLPLFKTKLQRASSLNRPTLYGFSPSVIPKPPDWKAMMHVTGFWHLESPPQWTPPQNLVKFIAAGPAPLYIGFGSTIGKNAKQLTEIVLRALAKTGQRAIISKGWGGLEDIQGSDSIFTVDSIPHHWLFPQTSMVIHHGGAGTTAAGLLAGIPSVVLPRFADQFFWGERVLELGVGPKPIPLKKLSTTLLSQTIQEVFQNRKMQETAQKLGDKLRKEDGVAQGVNAFQREISGFC